MFRLSPSVVMSWHSEIFRRSALTLSLLFVPASLRAEPLDRQLLEDAPPAKASETPVLPPVMISPKQEPFPTRAPKTSPDQPLDTHNPLTRIAGKMELVEQRLSTGLNTTIVGMQRDILADLDRLLAPGEPKNSGTDKEGNPKSDPAKQNQNQKQSNSKQPSGKQQGEGSESPNGSGQGEGNTEPRKPSVRELMEASWGNLPARERERVLEAAGESFLPKYARSLRQYFERLAEEDAGK